MSVLSDGVLAGDVRAVARACRRIDERAAGFAELVAELFPHAGRGRVLGITGSPGAGKSTLTDGLISLLRQRGERVGVIAVDPSSPFTGGALLGDRIRMQGHSGDAEVFIRSVATRGAHGGVSRSAAELVTVLQAWGASSVIVETVGVGQAELDVLGMVDTLAVVVVPGMGDEVQANKAGILEAADVLVLNKADHQGVDAAEHELAFAMSLGSEAVVTSRAAATQRASRAAGWVPPIVRCVASRREGLPQLLDSLDAHGHWLSATQAGQGHRRSRGRHHFSAVLRELLADAVVQEQGARRDALLDDLLERRTSPTAAAEALLAAYRSQH